MSKHLADFIYVTVLAAGLVAFCLLFSSCTIEKFNLINVEPGGHILVPQPEAKAMNSGVDTTIIDSE